MVLKSEWIDPWYDLFTELFIPGTQVAKRRIAADLSFIQKHLPKEGSLVLDLCCGGGIFSFELEKLGYTVIGIDIEQKMIDTATQYALKYGFKAVFHVGDSRKLSFKNGTFDAIVFLGNNLGHFTIGEFREVANEAFLVLKKGGVMISTYLDTIESILKGYPMVLYQQTPKSSDVVSFHIEYVPDYGRLSRFWVDFTKNRKFKSDIHIWTPWIFRHVMENAGFRLKNTKIIQAYTKKVADVHEK